MTASNAALYRPRGQQPPSTNAQVANYRPRVKVDAAFGRIYVNGPDADVLQSIRGATWNDRRRSMELSLTIETLRAIRDKFGFTKEEMAARCSPTVLQWARAAGRMERVVLEMHHTLSTGWRMQFPWTDTRAGTPAPESALPDHVEVVDGVRVWKYRPAFDHQAVMATVGCTLDGAAYICDMGTGKTRAAIESIRFKLEKGDVDFALVVCPKAVMQVWQEQVKSWSVGLNVVRLSGITVKKRCELMLNVVRAGTPRTLFLVNYDVLADMLETIVTAFGEKKGALVFDEMHTITNPEAQVTKAAMALAGRAPWRLGMTGTPIPNKVRGLWSEWFVLDLGITFGANFVQFRREWFDVNEWSMDETPKKGSLEAIGMRLRKRGVRFTKADCLDLPPKVYEVQEIEMTRPQAAAYKEMEAELVARLHHAEEADTNELVTAATQLVAILRLSQITSGFAPNEEGVIRDFLPNPKLDALEEIVRENIGSQQVIVWAQYRHDIANIVKRLDDLHPVIIQGSQRDDVRQAAQDTFQNSTARLLVANPAAGGVGLNLQAASLAIYYSQGYSLLDRAQSEDRCHRSGSEVHSKVTYVDLVCKGTVDEVVRSALAEKKSVAEAVVDLRRAIGA